MDQNKKLKPVVRREQLKMKYVNSIGTVLAKEVLKCDFDKNIPAYTFNNIPPKRMNVFVSKIKYSNSQFTNIKLKINNQRMDSILSELSVLEQTDYQSEQEKMTNMLFDFNSGSEEVQLREISESSSELYKHAIVTNQQFRQFAKTMKKPNALQQKIIDRKILRQ